MYPVIFFGLALISILIHLSRVKKRTTPKVIEVILLWLLVWNIGVQGVFAGLFQVLTPDQIARDIGWPIGSPFEFELGMSNIGIGIAALMGLFWRGKYWLGPILINTIFIYGAAYGHFVQQAKGDHAAYNSGIFLYVGDIIIPTIILVFTVLYYFLVLTRSKK